MGKEGKIGLAVIVVLLIIFGVVVYNRLGGRLGDRSTSVSRADTEDRQGPSERDGRAEERWGKFEAPTVVPAKAGSDNLSEESSASGLDRWTISSDEGERDDGRSDSSSSYLMPPPKLAAASSTERYGRYGGAQTPGTAADSGQQYGSFQNQAAATAVAEDGDSATQTAESPGPFTSNTLLNSVRQSDPQQADSSYGSPGVPNPLRGQGGATQSSDAAWQQASQDRYASSYSQGSADVYQNSSHIGRSHSTYRAPADPPQPAGQNDFSQGSLGLGNLSRQRDAAASAVEDGKYVVQPNDNYWVISGKLYGTGAYFRALAEHNRKQHPDENQLRVGEEILAPSISELEDNYGDLCPRPAHRDVAQRRMSMVSTSSPLAAGKVYEVQEGDTLFDIARFELGKASRWVEIYELNQGVLGEEFDYLTPGMRLILPKEQSPGTVTQRSESVYQR